MQIEGFPTSPWVMDQFASRDERRIAANRGNGGTNPAKKSHIASHWPYPYHSPLLAS